MASGGSDQPCCSAMFWVYLMICVGLVMFAGLMSGLTLGLMSLSLVDLEVLVKAGKPKDQHNAGLFPSPRSLFLCLFPSPPFLISVTPCASSFFYRSQDSSCCKESAPPALHPAHRQLPRHGGLCCSSPHSVSPAHVY